VEKTGTNPAWNERPQEIAFASPRAVLEARMIEAMDKARRPRRGARGNETVAGSPRRE
jgi:hypothetical protein